MISLFRRLVGTGLVVALLLVAAPASPAHASPTFWSAVPCATGDMTPYVAGPFEIWVSGWIEPCPETNPRHVLSASFSVVYYPVSGAPFRGRHLLYDGAGVRTAFGGQLNGGLLGLAAVCLAFDSTGRLACLAVESTGTGFVSVPIGVDDSRVAAPVGLEPRTGNGGPGTNPTCGNCV
ncbi:hypothetical protein [Verrucosispora sp. NA02020]|uniref:hypothetical protein n=1 Tax=Verrucosispora sp. NA02020 TaxID=2742132 RepID=UPI001591189E|nr:hypothetical protein [Verrucosispora sp. NA02020]QKW13661.1 hypothetical protein HUT12_13295 [Verrucosispora sp. NA02020]